LYPAGRNEKIGPGYQEVKRVKHKRIWFLAALAALTGVFLALNIGFDSETLKMRLIEEVRTKTQRELTIDGPLRLKFFPRLAVTVGSVSLSDSDGRAAPFLTLCELTGAIKILPLLRGHAVINRVEIRRLHVRAVRYADGRANFDDLLALKSEGGFPLEIDVEKVVLLDGGLSWQDDMTGRHLELEEIYLRTGHLGRQARGKLEMGGHIRMEQENVRATLGLESLYWLRGAQNNPGQALQLDNPRTTLKGEGYGLESLRLELTARQIRTAMDSPSLALERFSLQGKANWQNAPLVLDIKLEEMALNPEGGQMRHLAARLARAEDNAPFSFQLQMDNLQGEKAQWQSERLALEGRGAWEGQEIRGQLATPVTINLSPEGTRLQAAALQGEMWAKPGGKLAQPVHLELRGTLEADSSTRQLEGAFDLGLDESKLAIIWQLGLEPLTLNLDANLNRLDLDRYLKDSGTPREKTVSSPSASAPALEKESLDVQGNVRIGVLQYQGVRLENLNGKLRMRQGKLEIESESRPQKTSGKRGEQKTGRDKKAGGKQASQR
jgi:AsmA protein